MASSAFKTTNYTSSLFTESAGLVLFDLVTDRVCLLLHRNCNGQEEYLLPKGRRNIGGSRADAALRETREETGFRCRLLSVHLSSRQTRLGDAVDCADEVRMVESVRDEPFMMSMRELGRGTGRVKVVWWFAGVVEEGEDGVLGGDGGESGFEAQWFGFGEAAERCTFEGDREVVREGLAVFKRTVGGEGEKG